MRRATPAGGTIRDPMLVLVVRSPSYASAIVMNTVCASSVCPKGRGGFHVDDRTSAHNNRSVRSLIHGLLLNHLVFAVVYS